MGEGVVITEYSPKCPSETVNHMATFVIRVKQAPVLKILVQARHTRAVTSSSLSHTRASRSPVLSLETTPRGVWGEHCLPWMEPPRLGLTWGLSALSSHSGVHLPVPHPCRLGRQYLPRDRGVGNLGKV